MMQQQQTPPATLAPGNPIGYAPIYSATPPPLASDVSGTPPVTQGNATEKRWIDGFLIGGLVFGLGLSLVSWGVLDNLYAGADIRSLERRAVAANATAEAVEQRASNAEAKAQEWQVHSQAQGQTLDGVRALVCR